MKTTALVLSAATLTLLTLVPAMAQQTTGAPGSPSATTTRGKADMVRRRDHTFKNPLQMPDGAADHFLIQVKFPSA